jgi:hypothetical protein
MTIFERQTCDCGSGLPVQRVVDAFGNLLFYACGSCRQRKMIEKAAADSVSSDKTGDG